MQLETTRTKNQTQHRMKTYYWKPAQMTVDTKIPKPSTHDNVVT